MGDDLIYKGISADFLYEQLPSGFISFRPDGNILRVNDTLCKWLGLNEEQISGRNFMSLLSKGSLLYYNIFVNPLLLLKSAVNEINLKFITPDGYFDALFNAVSYVDDDGKMWLINCTIQKITDRKKYEVSLLSDKRQAEEDKRRFEFLYNLVPTQIWTSDPSGRIISVNQKFKDYFGDLDEVSLSSFAFVDAEDKELVLMNWANCMDSGLKFEMEVKLKGLSGKAEWFLVCAEPYFNENDEIEVWYGSSTNIHKQKIFHLSEISSLNNHLKIAERTINENEMLFVNIAMDQSHMVRKPLANILGLVNLLKDQDLDDSSRQLVQMLTKSSMELDRMIKKASAAVKIIK